MQEIEAAQGSINLNELSRKLSVERSALDGMIAYWMRKGRIKDDEREQEQVFVACRPGNCSIGRGCPGPQGCPFIMKMPRTYSLTKNES
ncbi:MAG: hypothetical protein JW953_12190 [Anaerolineae bacterium]|nr:hypothetical protein [Anaerolineae bacterium]